MKTFEGLVVSDKMAKTAAVLVERKYRHPLYGKIVTKKKKFHAENSLAAKVGQRVRMVETRPLSKTVSFKITEIMDVKDQTAEKKVKKVK